MRSMLMVMVLVGCGPVAPGYDAWPATDEPDGSAWPDPLAVCTEGVAVCPDGYTPGCTDWTLVEDRCVIFGQVTCHGDGRATCNGGRTFGLCIRPVDLPGSDGFTVHCG